MKINYLYLALVTFFISCDSTIDKQENNIKSDKTNQKNQNLPFNSSNSFDNAGQIHNEILEFYYQSSFLPTQTDSIINLFHSKVMEHPFFYSSTNGISNPIDYNEIEPLFTNPREELIGFLESSTLSVKAKSSLKDYIEELLIIADSDEEYSSIYSFITNYESIVSSEPSYSSSEKEIILTITSITRHSIYMKKKKPKKNTDPDWNWLTTNIIGSTAGGSGDIQKAIYTALIAGILENK